MGPEQTTENRAERDDFYPDNSTKAAREGDVHRALGALGTEQEKLAELVQHLAKRLHHVSRMSDDDGESRDRLGGADLEIAKAAGGFNTPLANNISNKTADLRRVRLQIESLLNKLEV